MAEILLRSVLSCVGLFLLDPFIFFWPCLPAFSDFFILFVDSESCCCPEVEAQAQVPTPALALALLEVEAQVPTTSSN
jgi:hypothetical protein